jgi:hypothetical protein
MFTNDSPLFIDSFLWSKTCTCHCIVGAAFWLSGPVSQNFKRERVRRSPKPYFKLRFLEKKMGRYISIGAYWMGSMCAGLGLFARGLDVLGMNFIDFNTKGGGIGYHSLMDGTLSFYSIAIATMVYTNFNSQKSSPSLGQESK